MMKEEMNKLLSLALNLDLNDIEDISTISIDNIIHSCASQLINKGANIQVVAKYLGY